MGAIEMKKTIAAIGAAMAMATAVPAQAEIINYDASDTRFTNGCSHGLYTGGTCERRYSFQDGTVFSIDTDTGTATLTGTALNSLGELATLDLTFSGFLDSLDGTGFDYKQNGGGAYDPANQDYWTSGMGTITIGGRTYSINPNDPFPGDTVLQFGDGANALNDAFGGSAWLNMLNPYGYSVGIWDINFNLTPITSVPAPAGMLLFGLGLFGAAQIRRRKKLAA